MASAPASAPADCTALRPGDPCYEVSPIARGGFAYRATVTEVTDAALKAWVDVVRYAPPTYWRATGRRLSSDCGSRCYLSPVLPEGVRLIEAPALRCAA